MALASWWRGDVLPLLAPLPHLAVSASYAPPLLARLAHGDEADLATRLDDGHRPYVAWLGAIPVAYGWVATRSATVGELDLTLVLPPSDRYLWDVATLPGWRGRGIYPRLLQAILAAEAPGPERFWIIHAPENRASAAGIATAGFAPVVELSVQAAGGVGLAALGPPERVDAAAALVGVPPLAAAHAALAPCWRCASGDARPGCAGAGLSCWPPPPAGSEWPCRCIAGA